jgi:hypothetical protein
MPDPAPTPTVAPHDECGHEHTPGDDRAAHHPASRAWPWLGPLALGVGVLGACVLLAVRDPNQPGSYGACPFKALTGLDCPGCGMMRGTHALFTGHPGRALDHNIFLPVIFALGVVGYVRWVRRSLGHDVPDRRPPPWFMLGAAIVVLTFWVVRNLGGPFDYLRSTA